MIRKITRTYPKTGKTYTYFSADGGTVNGKRERHSFKTKKEAQEWLQTFRRQQDKYGVSATALSSAQLSLAIEAFQRLTESKLNAQALVTAVQEYIERQHIVANSIPFEVAYKEYLETFDATTQPMQIKSVRITLKRLLHAFGVNAPLSSITKEPINAFFEQLSHEVAPKTYNNTLSYAKTFFAWCVKKGHLAETPIVVSQKRVAYKDPTFVKVDDLRNALHALEAFEMDADDKRQLFNFITLSFFCGIRSSEIFRLTADAIHPEDERPFVRISTTKGAARGIKGRIVDLEANAVAWFKRYPFKGGIREDNLSRIRASLRASKNNPFDAILVKNIARHSYITYHTAKYRDYARTEAYVGTSASMRVRHYQGLATTADGEAYFDIFPPR